MSLVIANSTVAFDDGCKDVCTHPGGFSPALRLEGRAIGRIAVIRDDCGGRAVK